MCSPKRRGISPVVIGVLQFELHVPWAQSLKDKRSVVRSVKDRLHREHQVSVAEVAANDLHTLAVLGIAVVATDGARAGCVLDRITEKLRTIPDAALGQTSREIIHGTPVTQGCTKEDRSDSVLARDLMEMARQAEGALR